MKKLYLVITALLLTASVWAQAPQKMSYQAVIRNSSNALLTSTPVGMQISILQGSSTGTAVYVETQTVSTNANGLVSLEIGTGTVITGTFSAINWATGPYFIKTETDLTGGTAYTIAGTNELMSVPYALFSANGTPGPVGPTGAAGTNGTNGTNGLDGAVGATGAAGTNGTNGAVGATGATGLLSSGAAAGNTTFWDGTQWVLNNSNLFNYGGNIGIGTTTPQLKLTVEGDIIANGGMYFISGPIQSTFPSGIQGSLIYGSRVGGTQYPFLSSGNLILQSTSDLNRDILFVTGSTPSIKMNITSTGNVGIGTSSPARTLHVSDVMRLEPRATAPASPSKGDMYFDNIINKLRVYDGTTWQSCW
jgi:hypothetical protein